MRENIRESEQPTKAENPFADTCRKMHTLAVSIQNWMYMNQNKKTEIVRHEQGCLRSIRLMLPAPVTHEATANSAVQLCVVPASFDSPGKKLYNHPQWHILMYSSLGREDTIHLTEHLRSGYDLHNVSVFLVRPLRNEKIA